MTKEDPIAHPESRFVEIETKLMLAEDLLETLNNTVYRQQLQIERLERALRGVGDQVEALSAAAELKAPQDELPPHY